MKKAALVLAVLAIFLATPFFMAGVSAAKNAPKKTPKVVIVKKKPAPKKNNTTKKVLGLFTSIFGGSLVDCHMPDGKTIRVTKKLCDDVNAFWSKNKPSNPGPSNSGGGGGNSGSNDSPSVQFTIVNDAKLMPCTSSSCGIISTVKVNGAKFESSARVELTKNGVTYGENTSYNYAHDAQLVGLNDSEIIMDFYNLPHCTTFGVQVKQNGILYGSPVSITTPCI